MRLPDGKPPPMDYYGHNPFSRRFPDLCEKPYFPGPRYQRHRHAETQLDRVYHRPVKLWLSEFTVSSNHGNRAFSFAVSRPRRQWLTAAFRLANSVHTWPEWAGMTCSTSSASRTRPDHRPAHLSADAEAGLLRVPARPLTDGAARADLLSHALFPARGGGAADADRAARADARPAGSRGVVHTGFPHYPSGVDRGPIPQPAVARRAPRRIPIVRSAVYPAPNPRVRPPVHRSCWVRSQRARDRPLSGPVDVVVGETPPLFTAAAAVVYAAAKRAAYVVNVADRWPESAVQLGALRDPGAIAPRRPGALHLPSRRSVVAPTRGSSPRSVGSRRRLQGRVGCGRSSTSTVRSEAPSRPASGADRCGCCTRARWARPGLEVLVEASSWPGPGWCRPRSPATAPSPRLRAWWLARG